MPSFWPGKAERREQALQDEEAMLIALANGKWVLVGVAAGRAKVPVRRALAALRRLEKKGQVRSNYVSFSEDWLMYQLVQPL